VQRIDHFQQGAVFRWLFGELRDPYTYLLPLLVLAVLIGLISALELAKKAKKK
jgi:hypothetical protein